jgi:hypothetical protein
VRKAATIEYRRGGSPYRIACKNSRNDNRIQKRRFSFLEEQQECQ